MQRDIPEFLHNDQHIVYCDNLHLRRHRSCLVLTRNLKFYEFQCKQLLHSVDLQETCMSQVAERLNIYDGPKGGYMVADNRADSSQTTCSNTSGTALPSHSKWQQLGVSELNFGKFVYRNKHIYILLRCWDKLVVLQRPGTPAAGDYKVIAEYENIADYKLIRSKLNYQALVELQFEQGKGPLRTDFQLDPCDDASLLSVDSAPSTSLTEFKQLLQRVDSARAELLLHRQITQRDFSNMSEIQTFGPPMQRSPLLEEKQLLARCGDIWMRTTTDDVLVLGVPLVNQAGTSSLSIVKNLKPMLQVDGTAADQTKFGGISYVFRLFQLRQRMSDFEHVDEMFFEAQDASLQKLAWHSVLQQQLLPETSAVLLVKLDLMQLVTHTQLHLFISYDVSKQMGLQSPTVDSCAHQLFLKTVDIAALLQQRRQHEISFSDATLQQDFMAVTMAHAAMCRLELTFNSGMDCVQFTQLLITRYEFCVRESCCTSSGRSTPEGIMTGDVDDRVGTDGTVHTSGLSVYYNRLVTSQWHGMLLLRESLTNLRFKWTFYARSETKLCLMLRVLFQDLLHYKCNVTDVRLLNDAFADTEASNMLPGIRLEHALRQELQAWHVVATGERQKSETATSAMQKLYKLQMETDLLASVIKPTADNLD